MGKIMPKASIWIANAGIVKKFLSVFMHKILDGRSAGFIHSNMKIQDFIFQPYLFSSNFQKYF
jgi:hypothetical protein